jgi:subtilisin family serine protease
VKYDGYANNPKVIAVSACNDTNRQSVYSDYGDNVWCAFPSSDFPHPPFQHPAPLTEGIYTTDRMNAAGYGPGNYTGDFGGTSSACPGVAGIVALMLSVNPDLTWMQVKEILRDTSEKIDVANGKYDAQGHSVWYGFGKADAEKAVKKAIELKSTSPAPKVKIISALVNPAGADKGKEKISVLNPSAVNVDLTGWYFQVNTRKQVISGLLAGGEAKTVALNGSVKLPNGGATITLLNDKSEIKDTVSYQKKQVKKGETVLFQDVNNTSPVSADGIKTPHTRGKSRISGKGVNDGIPFFQRDDEPDNNL